VSKAIGFTLTITGLVLGVWFVRIVTAPDLAPLQAFVVAAMAAAMISVGLRYVLRKKKKPEAAP
jgi:hypothetical protein